MTVSDVLKAFNQAHNTLFVNAEGHENMYYCAGFAPYDLYEKEVKEIQLSAHTNELDYAVQETEEDQLLLTEEITLVITLENEHFKNKPEK